VTLDNISDEGAKALLDGIVENLGQLKELSLAFNR